MNWYVFAIQSIINAACFVGGHYGGRWYLRRKLRPRKPISLPGMSQEEAETETFLEQLSDDTRDDIQLVKLNSVPSWRRNKPILAISATAFEANMHRIRTYMDARRTDQAVLVDETIIDNRKAQTPRR